jgi:hypothetical protein
MRRATLITGIVLMLLGAALAGYHLYDIGHPKAVHIEHYLHDSFVRGFTPWTIHLSWVNSTATSATTGGYTLYVTLDVPTTCTNPSHIVASSVGSSGTLTVQVPGATDWYAFLCDASGHPATFDATYHEFGVSYYLASGIGIIVVGAGVAVIAFLQRPAPPMLHARRPRMPASDSPPTKEQPSDPSAKS